MPRPGVAHCAMQAAIIGRLCALGLDAEQESRVYYVKPPHPLWGTQRAHRRIDIAIPSCRVGIEVWSQERQQVGDREEEKRRGLNALGWRIFDTAADLSLVDDLVRTVIDHVAERNDAFREQGASRWQ
jgi:hypothetical protein